MAKASIKLHGEGARPNAPQAGRAVAPRPPQLVRLGEVSQVNYGTRIRSKDSTSDAYPVYGGGGKTFGWAEFNRENQCVVSRFAMSEECVRFVSGKFFLNDSGLTVDADDVNIQQEYLNWFLLGHQREIYSLGRGCAQKNLRVDSFLDMQIPLPPLPEQKRIAAILDKICEMKRNAEARLQKLDLLVKARFVEMFGSFFESPKLLLSDVARRVKVAFVGTCGKYYTDANSGVPMIRTTNITKDGLDLTDLKYVSYDFHVKNKKSQLHDGDILIARFGNNGQACIYRGSEANCLNAIIIEPDESKIDAVFLVAAINSNFVNRQVAGNLVGTTFAILNTKKLAKLKVGLPPLTLQRQFAAFVEKVEGLKATAKKELEQVDLLYRAKLQEFFG